MANRVWFDARSLSRRYTTGWERYVRELAVELPKLIDITLWTPKTDNRLALLLSDFRALKSRSGHQVVHFPTYPPRGKKINTSQVITVHDLTWWKYPETSSFLGNNYYKTNMTKALFQADGIICPSNSIKTELISKFSLIPNKIVSIPHGNSLPTGIKQKPHKPYFLSIGTVEPRKNLDFYAKAITESGLSSHFDFFHVGRQGWGKLPERLKSVETNSNQELANLITNATAVVLPSLYEGFGLPVLESHVQGIPVIISNTGALIELSNPSDKIFELGNLESLVESLQYFSQQETRLSTNELEIAKSLTWLKSAEKHVEVYVGLLK
jgi:glycosyltransferase involved in cell wall biosynthesis